MAAARTKSSSGREGCPAEEGHLIESLIRIRVCVRCACVAGARGGQQQKNAVEKRKKASKIIEKSVSRAFFCFRSRASTKSHAPPLTHNFCRRKKPFKPQLSSVLFPVLLLSLFHTMAQVAMSSMRASCVNRRPGENERRARERQERQGFSLGSMRPSETKPTKNFVGFVARFLVPSWPFCGQKSCHLVPVVSSSNLPASAL